MPKVAQVRRRRYLNSPKCYHLLTTMNSSWPIHIIDGAVSNQTSSNCVTPPPENFAEIHRACDFFTITWNSSKQIGRLCMSKIFRCFSRIWIVQRSANMPAPWHQELTKAPLEIMGVHCYFACKVCCDRGCMLPKMVHGTHLDSNIAM